MFMRKTPDNISQGNVLWVRGSGAQVRWGEAQGFGESADRPVTE